MTKNTKKGSDFAENLATEIKEKAIEIPSELSAGSIFQRKQRPKRVPDPFSFEARVASWKMSVEDTYCCENPEEAAKHALSLTLWALKAKPKTPRLVWLAEQTLSTWESCTNKISNANQKALLAGSALLLAPPDSALYQKAALMLECAGASIVLQPAGKTRILNAGDYPAPKCVL